ncbi:MAG: aspartate aminotransferase family protein [Ectothiorhodospiraceae bacterium]|nr:aspartate aminotransferase family protein [Chromatiales bacterium]MCP5156952.1 aspartate aminotransferase family protein [Ectothiorhodospiraceae bacterium]
MSTVTDNRGTAEWRELDRKHHLHPFTDFAGLASEGSRIIVRAEGVHLWDSDGERMIDGMAGLWCVNIGYGRRELADAAYHQMLELPFYNNFFKTTHPPAVALAETLSEVTPPHMSRVFFTGSGSESNDTVLRMVRRYWDLVGEPTRRIVISRENAYHGSTIGSASLGGMKPMHDQGHLPIPDITHVMQPYWFRLGGDRSPAEFGLHAARALEERILELGPENVAAFVAEPIQGAGGVIVPPDTYWPEVARICERHGILLVADEVICGFGRTGKWFGSDYYGLRPDLMPMAKGITSGYLPLGAVMVGDRVADVLTSRGGEFAHGFTYSGHPTCCAVALANIRIMRAEGIVERVETDIGPYFQAALRELADHPLVGEVRGVGLIGALQLCKDKSTRELFQPEGQVGTTCRDHCFSNGLIMRATLDSMLLSPPLVITRSEVDEIMEKARLCLDLTARDHGIA